VGQVPPAACLDRARKRRKNSLLLSEEGKRKKKGENPMLWVGDRNDTRFRKKEDTKSFYSWTKKGGKREGEQVSMPIKKDVSGIFW